MVSKHLGGTSRFIVVGKQFLDLPSFWDLQHPQNGLQLTLSNPMILKNRQKSEQKSQTIPFFFSNYLHFDEPNFDPKLTVESRTKFHPSITRAGGSITRDNARRDVETCHEVVEIQSLSVFSRWMNWKKRSKLVSKHLPLCSACTPKKFL